MQPLWHNAIPYRTDQGKQYTPRGDILFPIGLVSICDHNQQLTQQNTQPGNKATDTVQTSTRAVPARSSRGRARTAKKFREQTYIHSTMCACAEFARFSKNRGRFREGSTHRGLPWLSAELARNSADRANSAETQSEASHCSSLRGLVAVS